MSRKLKNADDKTSCFCALNSELSGIKWKLDMSVGHLLLYPCFHLNDAASQGPPDTT